MDKGSQQENGLRKEDKAIPPETAGYAADGSQDEEHAQIDDLIGSFGKYQFLIFMFKILIGATSAFNNLGVSFYAPRDFIGHTCVNRPISNATYNWTASNPQIGLPAQDSHPSFGRPAYQRPQITLLRDFVVGQERSYQHRLNKDYDTPRDLTKQCTSTTADNATHKCTAWEYDKGIWISTIIDEWDLVCDDSWYISLTQSLYMLGFIPSYLLFGFLSDRYGRWRSLLIGAIIEVTSGFGCAFAGSVTEFLIFRVLLGLGNAGRSSSSYLIMIEWTGPKWRMHISTLGSIGWVLGYSLMPWITLHYLHFRHMQLFVCFYEIVFIIWFLRLPESPRWLLTHKKWNEAYDVLLEAAKFNGLIKQETPKIRSNSKVIYDNDGQNYVKALSYSKKVEQVVEQKPLELTSPLKAPKIGGFNAEKQDKPLEPYTIEEYSKKFQRLAKMIESKEFTKNENKLNIFDLFKWKNLRKYISILAIAWASNSFIYYGFALKVGDSKGSNLFIAFSWAGLAEIPAMILTIVAMKFLPRKTTNIYMFAMVGLLSALQLPLKYYDYPWLSETTNILAKLFNSCSFTCILYQTIELFPTSIRQTAYSTASLSQRCGSILAPFVKELEKRTNQMVPSLIYLTLSVIEIVLIRKLPETKGSDLPDTLMEAEKFKGTDKAKKGKKSQSSSTEEINLGNESKDGKVVVNM